MGFRFVSYSVSVSRSLLLSLLIGDVSGKKLMDSGCWDGCLIGSDLPPPQLTWNPKGFSREYIQGSQGCLRFFWYPKLTLNPIHPHCEGTVVFQRSHFCSV